jgi:hypothetical protein
MWSLNGMSGRPGGASSISGSHFFMRSNPASFCRPRAGGGVRLPSVRCEGSSPVGGRRHQFGAHSAEAHDAIWGGRARH